MRTQLAGSSASSAARGPAAGPRCCSWFPRLAKQQRLCRGRSGDVPAVVSASGRNLLSARSRSTLSCAADAWYGAEGGERSRRACHSRCSIAVLRKPVDELLRLGSERGGAGATAAGDDRGTDCSYDSFCPALDSKQEVARGDLLAPDEHDRDRERPERPWPACHPHSPHRTRSASFGRCQHVAGAELAEDDEPGTVTEACRQELAQMRVGEQRECLVRFDVTHDVAGGPGWPVSNDVADGRVLPARDDSL